MTHALDYAKPTPPSRLIRGVHVAGIGYPLLLLVAFYGSWALAWIALGHRPRPSLDDPAQVLGPVYLISVLAVLALPVGAMLSVVSTIVRFTAHRKRQALVWSAAIAISWLVVLTLLRADPHLVVYWWLD